MNEFVAVLILLLFFILRFIVPAAVLLGLGYILHRIQSRWVTEVKKA